MRARCLEILRKDVHCDEFWPSMHAAEALTLTGHGDEVKTLLTPKLATETDEKHRIGLARELVRAGDDYRKEIILKILADDDSQSHTHACESLFKVNCIGNGVAMRKRMANENPITALMAAAALGRWGSPAAMSFIREKLTDNDPDTSRIAAWVIARLGDSSDIAQLRKNVAAAKDDPKVRRYAEHALAMLGDAAGVAALLRNLDSDDPGTRTDAATFAGEVRVLTASKQLVAMLDDAEIDPRVRAAQSLLLLSKPAKDANEDICVDVYKESPQHPRNSEGSVIELHDGSLLFTTTQFLGEKGDAGKAHIVARGSRDGGRTWGPIRVLQENIGRRNVMSVTLRRLPKWPKQPAIGMFFLLKNSDTDLNVLLRVSNDECKTFGEAIEVTDGPGYHVFNNDRATLLCSGRIVVPVAWTADSSKVNHYVCFCRLSDDGGKTWQQSKGKIDFAKRGAMEPEVVELRDGRLLMIMRTQLGYIAASYSSDGGETWSKASPFGVKAPEAPSTIRRIPSTGDLLLVYNNTFTPGAGHGGRRTPLTAAISSDDGKTWKHIRNLETDPKGSFCYTSMAFAKGRVVLSYCYSDTCRFRSLPIAWFYKSTEPGNITENSPGSKP
ncbi:MAG: exo-alpha-sialidase [Planctomycetota bacterium]|nr:exo-alpha-sialidase [Planctomycetota bacterium]